MEEKCMWCGRTYEQHETQRAVDAAVPKVPCLLLKSGFVKSTTKEVNPVSPITKTIMESLEEFDKHVPPPPSFSDIQEIIEAWQRMQPPENYTATEAMMAENEWKRRMALWKQIKSHLLQSQIKVIEAVIESLKKGKLYFIGDNIANSHGSYYPTEVEVATEESYNQALEDQISSLNQVKESIQEALNK